MKSKLPLLCLLLLPALPAQGHPAAEADRIAAAAGNRAAWPFDRVLYDEGIDSRLWACGASWKASFGNDGFTFVPRFGADAPSSRLHFDLTAVRVAGHALPLARDVAATRDGDVVSFPRGAVTESYRLALDQVEQTFTIDAGPGDVDVELTLATDLTERTELPGLQFANAHGEVGYGDAFVVTGGAKTPIATTWDGQHLTLHVDANQRGDGPLVIDPILNTRGAAGAASVPSIDVAYDATLQRYLLVWEIVSSSTDHDVVTEQFDGNGDPIAGSAAPVEISGLLAERPRTASLDVADAFLVAFSLADPNFGNRRMVFSRTFAAATSAVGPYERLSNPFLPGDNVAPEVGADPGSDPNSPHDWLVVWNNVESAADANVHGRAVLANGTPKHTWVLVIEDGVNTFNSRPQVSRSNGNGQVPFPCWLVTYQRPGPNSSTRIHARSLDLGFNLGSEMTFTTVLALSRNPQVSSPIAGNNATVFMLTWERQGSGAAEACLAYLSPAPSGGGVYDLTALFGLDGNGMRCESDGVRFVLVSHGTGADERMVSTLAFNSNGSLVLHDGPTSLGSSPVTPEIVACRSSGGPVAQYGIAWTEIPVVSLPKLTRYGGYQSGTMIAVRNTACHGLGMQSTGLPVLGDAMQFALSSVGGDIPGFAFGSPATSAIPICTTCSLGLRLDQPIVVGLGSTSFAVTIPPIGDLVGSPFAVQGLALGSWPCFGLRFSDTVQFTIR